MQHRLMGTGGFSLVEILIAVLILTLAIVPIINAIGPAVETTAAEAEFTVYTNQARATLNRILTVDYATLNVNLGPDVDLSSLLGSTEEANREKFVLNGQSYTPRVDIADASGGAGGLLALTVIVGQVRLTTLKADY